MRGITRSMIVGLFALFCLICVTWRPVSGGPQGGAESKGKSISGVVLNSASGKPEAGVWVIAETKLSVPYRKIVVTDDQGRFLAPDRGGARPR